MQHRHCREGDLVADHSPRPLAFSQAGSITQRGVHHVEVLWNFFHRRSDIRPAEEALARADDECFVVVPGFMSVNDALVDGEG